MEQLDLPAPVATENAAAIGVATVKPLKTENPISLRVSVSTPTLETNEPAACMAIIPWHQVNNGDTAESLCRAGDDGAANQPAREGLNSHQSALGQSIKDVVVSTFIAFADQKVGEDNLMIVCVSSLLVSQNKWLHLDHPQQLSGTLCMISPPK